MIESSIAIGLANDISIVFLFIITLHLNQFRKKNILKIVLEAVLNLRGLKITYANEILLKGLFHLRRTRFMSKTKIS